MTTLAILAKRIIYVWYKKAYSICRVVAQTLRNYIRLIVQFFNGLQNNLLSRLAYSIFLRFPFKTLEIVEIEYPVFFDTSIRVFFITGCFCKNNILFEKKQEKYFVLKKFLYLRKRLRIVYDSIRLNT